MTKQTCLCNEAMGYYCDLHRTTGTIEEPTAPSAERPDYARIRNRPLPNGSTDEQYICDPCGSLVIGAENLKRHLANNHDRPDTSDTPKEHLFTDEEAISGAVKTWWDAPTQTESFEDVVIKFVPAGLRFRVRAAHRASQEQLLDTAAERLLALAYNVEYADMRDVDVINRFDAMTVINDLKKGLK